MSESENVFRNNDEFWDFVKENPQLIGIPVSESKGLDLLGAMKDVREAYRKDPEIGDTMITMLGTLLAGVANGDGEAMVEEVIVSEAMAKFDSSLSEVLDEGR